MLNFVLYVKVNFNICGNLFSLAVRLSYMFFLDDFLFTPVLYQIVSWNRMCSDVNKYGL
jgi:hypothetical protein